MSVETEVEVKKIILMKNKDFWQLAIHKNVYLSTGTIACM